MSDPNIHEIDDPLSYEALNQNVDPYQKIGGVEVVFEKAEANRFLLDYLTKDLKNASNFKQLHKRLSTTIETLEKSDVYAKHDVKLEPGESQDKVRIIFNLKRKTRYFGSLSQFFNP